MLGCGVLAICLGVQVLMPSTPALTEPPDRAVRRLKPIVAPAVADYPAILQTPVFSPDRKLSMEDDATPGAGALAGFTALGIAKGHGFATALMKAPDGVVTTLRLGDSVQGWRLVGVERDKLTFQRDTTSHVVPIGPPAAAAPQNGSDE